MKRFLLSAATAITTLCGSLVSNAEVPVTLVDRISPVDMVYMDMATEAAKANAAKNGVPQAVVIIVDNSAKATAAGNGAVQEAFKKSGLSRLDGAVVYSVNQPTTEDYLFLSGLGVKTIMFVNGKDKVIKAGINPASAYSDSSLPSGVTPATLKMMEYPDAQALIK